MLGILKQKLNIVNFRLPINLVEVLKEKFDINLTEVSEKEKDRRISFTRTLSKQKSTEEILAILKEKEKIETER